MEINFTTEGKVQIVELSGSLGEAESAAARNHLEKKINKGKSYVVFDLSGIDLDNEVTGRGLKMILEYTLNRGATAACSGIMPELWPHLLVEGPKQVELYRSRMEAIYYLSVRDLPPKEVKEEEKKEREEGEKKEGEEGKEEEKKELSKEEMMEEMKQEALNDLFKTYQIYQQHEDNDPFRLQFVVERNKEAPYPPTAEVEANAKAALEKVNEEIEQLTKDCETLALKVKVTTLQRKIASTKKEVAAKITALNKVIGEHKDAIESFQTKIKLEEDAIAKSKQDLVDAQKALDEEIKELGEAIAKQEKENEAIAKGEIPKEEPKEEKKEEAAKEGEEKKPEEKKA